MEHLTQLWLLAGHAMSVLGFIMAILLVSRVRSRPAHPGTTMAWLLGMVFLPWVAIPLYLSFGGRSLRKRVGRKSRLGLSRIPEGRRPAPLGPVQRALARLKNPPPATTGNAVDFIASGERLHAELLKAIRGATSRIDIETFILSNDGMARDLMEELAAKARSGIKVRVLVDGIGSFWLRREFVKMLRSAGAEVAFFLPVLPFRRRWAANHRLHRKIYLVDGTVAFVGGHNLSQEYLGPTPMEGRWVDAAVRLEGPAVASVAEIFEADWAFAAGGEPTPVELVPPATGSAVVQAVASGPDAHDEGFQDVLLTAMMEAQERLWIVTPYFVPDETILRILCVLAKLGRDVRVLVPARSNHLVADLARRSALRELQSAGGKVYLYRHGMMHAKLLLIDSEVASVGSPNVDMRSLYINFELALFLSSPAETKAVAEFMEQLMGRSEVADLQHRPRGVVIETLENIARLLSPLI